MLLAPAALGWLVLQEAIRVTAARSSVQVSPEDLRGAAAPTLDDALRQVPGLTLFRRTGSRTANPTSQGVSLRGIGPSGASRGVVLDDGVPLNDPFGGWVAWGRVPLTEIDRVEVVRGGASDLFGSGALGGAIRLLPRELSGRRLEARLEGGGLGTELASLAGDAPLAHGTARIALEAADVDGYVPVAAEERGAVDTPAGVRRRAARATWRRDLSLGTLFVRAATYDERRGNGTREQLNDTEIRDVAAGLDRAGERLALSARVFAGEYRYHQTFSAVRPDRSGETLLRDQHVPADVLGGSVRGVRVSGRHTVGVALEGQHVEGWSRETVLTGPVPAFAESGGSQGALALSAEDGLALPGGFRLEAGVRADAWWNAGRSDSALSPRLAVSLRSGRLTSSLSAYRAFRAPTLNELYRPFRVGDVTTLANDRLQAERLSGVEAGLVWSGSSVRASGSIFVLRLADAIANLTLSAGPEGIRRRRENLGATRTRGVEGDVVAALGGGWSVGAGVLLLQPEVTAAEDGALVGKEVPQVSRAQGSLRVAFRAPALHVAVQARAASRAFEDDRNALALAGYATIDLFLERALRPGLSLVAAGENLTDARIVAGRTPVTTLGTPRTFRLGVRLSLPGAHPAHLAGDQPADGPVPGP